MVDLRELSKRPLSHSQVALREWAGVRLFRSRSGPGTFTEHEHAEVQLSARIVRPESGRSLATPGSLTIVESGKPHGGTLLERAEFMMVYLEPDRLDEEAYDLTDRSSVDIRGGEESGDTWMTSALGVIYDELHGGPTNPVVAEALALSVLTRLLYSHSSLDPPRWSRVRPLSPSQVRQSCGMLGEALNHGISVTHVANELGLGTSRFAKAFRATVGIPPYAYLMLHRIRRAENLVQRTTRPLVDVAMECGFASQSHMTAQFKKLLGATPARYRQDRSVR